MKTNSSLTFLVYRIGKSKIQKEDFQEKPKEVTY